MLILFITLLFSFRCHHGYYCSMSFCFTPQFSNLWCSDWKESLCHRLQLHIISDAKCYGQRGGQISSVLAGVPLCLCLGTRGASLTQRAINSSHHMRYQCVFVKVSCKFICLLFRPNPIFKLQLNDAYCTSDQIKYSIHNVSFIILLCP